MKDNLIIYTSNRNNYDMVEGEILKIDFEGFEYFSVDDNSSSKELKKGFEMSEKHGFYLLKNKSRGVQMATQTLIDFISSHRPNCKWIICLQHDIKPITPNFFSRISNLIADDKLNEFGGLGFNVIDKGKYTFDSYDKWLNNEKPLGMLGLNHLSRLSNQNRWISPKHNPIAIDNPENWNKPFIIEIPMWAIAGINVNQWKNKETIIEPTNEYHFHIWYPDIIMQFNFYNRPCLILPDLYALNQQELKRKYDIPDNSARGAMKGDNYHFGHYNHHKIWKKRWGWDYEKVEDTYPRISDNYKNTLIDGYFMYDIMRNKKPYKTIDIGEY